MHDLDKVHNAHVPVVFVIENTVFSAAHSAKDQQPQAIFSHLSKVALSFSGWAVSSSECCGCWIFSLWVAEKK